MNSPIAKRLMPLGDFVVTFRATICIVADSPSDARIRAELHDFQIDDVVSLDVEGIAAMPLELGGDPENN
jgi:hypothetical protein